MSKHRLLCVHLGIILAAFWFAILHWNTADGADWKSYAENQNFSFYYNAEEPDPLKEILNIFKKRIVRVWTKRAVKNNKGRGWQIQENKRLGLSVKDYEQYEYTLSLKEINCSDKMIRSLSEADYAKEGNSLAKSESPFAGWSPVIPASSDESLYRTVCLFPEAEKQ